MTQIFEMIVEIISDPDCNWGPKFQVRFGG